MQGSIFVCLLAVLFSNPCAAQERPTPAEHTKPVPESKLPSTTRPTIGVALEGGGALGEAHVGVLKWFEEHHIPIDYLAGTSMGGLVGGMYATGKSADQLVTVLKTADWNLLLRGDTPYQALSFRRKGKRMPEISRTRSKSD